MFIGHWAPALAAAAASRRAPKIGTLFIAAQLVDWAFFGLLLAGVEHMRVSPGISVMNPMDLYHMPYTHSLLGSTLLAAGFALLIWLFTRNRTGALIGGVVVLSHWFLDLLVHAPDLTLAGSPPKFGFGLWDYPMIEMPLEIGITFGALAFYIYRTRAISSRSKYALGLLAVLLMAMQSINWFGPEPQSADMAMKLTGLFAFSVAALAAWWAGRTRIVKQT